MRKRRLEIRAEIVKIIQNILNQGGQSEIVTSSKRAKAILQYINNTNTQLKYLPKWLVVPVILDELKKMPYRGQVGIYPTIYELAFAFNPEWSAEKSAEWLRGILCYKRGVSMVSYSRKKLISHNVDAPYSTIKPIPGFGPQRVISNLEEPDQYKQKLQRLEKMRLGLDRQETEHHIEEVIKTPKPVKLKNKQQLISECISAYT